MNIPLLDRESARRLSATLAGAEALAPGERAQLDIALVGFLAHALPRRAAVWWGALCAWKVARPTPTEAEDQALQAAVRWAIEPIEEHRLAASGPAQAAGMKTPAGCLAFAASWSSGSLAPAGLPPVETPSDTTARLVAGAVMLAAVRGDALRFRDRYREFVAIGAEIAEGRNLWAEGDPLGLAPAPATRPTATWHDVASNHLDPIASAR
ncbi:DUF6931 family protein [Tundrisphaera sp. TA3]|uniref:DUF6931 family protein n=1 Tax=Tundrisphaera sp. TA3 TaxID=3435775 RepID=UPI003EB8C05C